MKNSARALAAVFVTFTFILATWEARGAMSTYEGNRADGGGISQGALTFTDGGSSLQVTLRNGSPTHDPQTYFDNNLVIFIDSVAGSGIHDTSTIMSVGTGLPSAISGRDPTSSSRWTATFAGSFAADYVIAFNAAGGYASHLISDGHGGMVLDTPSNFSLSGVNRDATYSFSVPWGALGLDGAPKTFSFESTFVGDGGYRTVQSFENFIGGAGWGNINFSTLDIFPVPEPVTTALGVFGSLAGAVGLVRVARRRLKA